MNTRECRRVGWNPPRHRGDVLPGKEKWVRIHFDLVWILAIRYVPFAGYLLVAIFREDSPLVAVREYRHWEHKDMRKPTSSPTDDGSSGTHLAAMETQVFGKLHALVKQCAVTRYEDGETRHPGSLFISTQGSMWRATVTEPSACLKLTMMAASLDDALAGLVLALESESVPWERDAYAESRKPKKKN